MGSRDNSLVGAPDLWSKGFEFESRQERQENFLLQSRLCVLTLIPCLFHPRVTAVARERPRSFCQKCRINTHTLLTQRSRSGLTMLLSRHKVGTYQETSSYATSPVTLGHSRLSSLSHCGLITANEWNCCARANSTFKKSAAREWLIEHSPTILAREERATAT